MLKLFISYSRKDIEWCRRLAAHLKGLGKDLLQEIWFDERIGAGEAWNLQISDKVDRADIVLLLVSSNFIDSEFCALEAERAMERRKQGACHVIPVMLRYCNPSGAVFAALNAYPPYDRPIDSKAWADKDLALKSVSDQVEIVARQQLRAGPKYKLLHPHRDELTVLLHHLCDRGPQKYALNSGFHDNRRKIRRPFLIIVQGQQHDSLEWFLNRLENVLLPRYLNEKPGRLSPLKWPEYQPNRTPFELFGSQLADCLPVSPFATVREMNVALNQMSPISLLPASMPSRPWRNSDIYLFEAFLQLWESWPRLPQDRVLIPVLEVQYPEEKDAVADIAAHLNGVNFSAYRDLGGAVLPPMEPVEHQHFRDWLNELQVRSRLTSPERALEAANQFRGEFPSRMHPLAELHLPRFLEEL